jgi:hypothetical protein
VLPLSGNCPMITTDDFIGLGENAQT